MIQVIQASLCGMLPINILPIRYFRAMNNLDEVLEKYNFELPPTLIAKYPHEKRSDGKLLELTPNGKINHADLQFSQLANLLEPNDLLIFNDTRVEKRRVFLQRKTGAKLETVFLQEDAKKNVWQCLIKKAAKLNFDETIFSIKNPHIEFVYLGRHKTNSQICLLQANTSIDFTVFEQIGNMPIPPYFNRPAEEIDDLYYQSIFAQKGKSAAAPTASLHFDTDLMDKLAKKNIQSEFLTLNVSFGTFSPLTQTNLDEKKLHHESFEISHKLLKKLQNHDYNRLIAVGTTTLRVLETLFLQNRGSYASITQLPLHSYIVAGEKHFSGEIDSFFLPPHQINSIDGLITNFHLPASTLLMLICCIQPRKSILDLYKEAISRKMKFFSYGDGTLLWRQSMKAGSK